MRKFFIQFIYRFQRPVLARIAECDYKAAQTKPYTSIVGILYFAGEKDSHPNKIQTRHRIDGSAAVKIQFGWQGKTAPARAKFLMKKEPGSDEYRY